MLTFAIPTKGRPRELSVAVRSIAEQIKSNARIVILWNTDEDDTARVVERLEKKWDCVSSCPLEGTPSGSEKLRATMRVEDEWIWTFGDDDKLMPGALSFMLERLQKADLSFIHVAERARAAGTTNTHTGRLIDLCCQFGWLDMTGFITGNITRGKWLNRCAESKNWDLFAKSAYGQSCALLESMLREQAQFIDLPLIDTQNEQQTMECLKRWSDENMGMRYLYVVDAIQLFLDQKLILKKLPPKFFRYANYHLWDRHITYFLSEYMQTGRIWPDDEINYIKRHADLIDDEKMAETIRQNVDAARRVVRRHSVLKQKSKRLDESIDALFKTHSVSFYPYSFADPA